MIIKYLLTILTLTLVNFVYADPINTVESATANYYTSIQKDPKKLFIFLQNMPKGADLHYHSGSGASMAENLISYGYDQQLCIDRTHFIVTKNANCAKENLLENVHEDSALYNAIIDSWSMLNFHPDKESGHDYFFSMFMKVQPIVVPNYAKIDAESINRAGKQNESYIELMINPNVTDLSALGKKVGWDKDLGALRKKLLANGLDHIVNDMQKNIDLLEQEQNTIFACGTKNAEPGCKVKVRYLYVALREQPPAQVFAQLLGAFELANKDTRMLGLNFAQAEDGYIAMHDYHLHMQMIGFLHGLYPKVHITLHAGELNSTLVPPDGLRFHIREAVDIAHAERIGHGVAVAYEANADQLLKEMAKKHILVEINLSSNDLILNVKGKRHPLPLYQSYGVPIALSTDDEGILRTTLTTEYLKAIMRYQFSYATLKNIVRNSITYSFLPGKKLWEDDAYQQIVPACQHDSPRSATLSTSCQQYLDVNEKAEMQWDLENRFAEFESQFKATK